MALLLLAGAATACESPGGAEPVEPDASPLPSAEPAGTAGPDASSELSPDPSARPQPDAGPAAEPALEPDGESDAEHDGTCTSGLDCEDDDPCTWNICYEGECFVDGKPPPVSCELPQGFDGCTGCWHLSPCNTQPGEGQWAFEDAADPTGPGYPAAEGARYLHIPATGCGFVQGPWWSLPPCELPVLAAAVWVDLPCLDGEEGGTFQIYVEGSADPTWKLRWDKPLLACGQYGQWAQALIGLHDFEGQEVRLQIAYKGDAATAGTGVAVDLVESYQGCP